MSSHKQRRYVQEVHEVLAAARRWNELYSNPGEHSPCTVSGCRRCESEKELQRAVVELDALMRSSNQ